LVKQLPEALWVISGRQKLRWEEVEKEWVDALSQHELGALPERSARQFLGSCGITNEPIQDAIAKGSQGVPHYLNLAVDTFLEIKQSGQRVPVEAESASTPEEVFAQFIRHLDQPEIATLQVLSASRFWNYGLFEHLVTEYQTGYPLAAYDDLSRFSFVGEGAAPETRTMHDLMREALQEHQAPELRKRVHLYLHELYAKQLEGLDVKGITDRHKAALNEAFYHGREAKSAEELLSWFEPVAGFFTGAGDYQLVTPLQRELVQMAEVKLGPNHPRLAAPLFDVAASIFLQGGYDEAEPLLRRALAIAEREPELNVNFIFYVLSHLATLLRDRACLDEAEVVSRRMVESLDTPGCNPDNRPNALSKLAVVLIHQRKYVEAEELLRRALRIYEEAPEPETHCLADHLNTLGYLFRMQARHAEAEPFFRRSLAMSEKTMGASHPDVVWPLGNLASTLGHLSRYSEAEPLFRRALKLTEEALGPDHPGTAMTLYKFSVLLLDQGRYAEAAAQAHRALRVFQKKNGPDHPDTFRTADLLTTTLAKRGNFAEAEPMALSAVANRENNSGPNHPETARALETAGVVLGGQGRYAEAEGYLRRALDIRTGVLGADHSDTLDSVTAMGILEERRGRYAEAESLYRDVLEKRERVQGPEHTDVANTASRLAGICSRDGRNAEAAALCRRALAIREKAFGPDHPFVAEVLDGLAKVWEQTGRAAEAQELSARAQRIRAQAEPAPNSPQQQA
jgi:tetratricopeptide (TPR) repeat protein